MSWLRETFFAGPTVGSNSMIGNFLNFPRQNNSEYFVDKEIFCRNALLVLAVIFFCYRDVFSDVERAHTADGK